MAGDALVIARDPNGGDALMTLPVICALAKRHKKLYLAMANEQVRAIADFPDNVVDALHEEPEFDSPRQMVTYVLGIAYGCNYLRGVRWHLTRHLMESVGLPHDDTTDIRPKIAVPNLEGTAEYDVVIAPWAAAESRMLTVEEAQKLVNEFHPLRVAILGSRNDYPLDNAFNQYGESFDYVVNLMRRAKVVITVESFGGRLAAAVQPRHHIMLSTTATPLFMQLYGGETVVPFTAGCFTPEATVKAVRSILYPTGPRPPRKRVVGMVADWGGCGFYRVSLPLDALGTAEVAISANEANATALAPDTVLYQRISSYHDRASMRLHKAAGRRVVMDFDDNLHAIPPSNPAAGMYGSGKPATVAFEEALQIADVVTCSTQGLKDEYAHLRPDIRVIPNALDPKHVALFEREYTGAPKREGQIRIGYSGTLSHKADLAIVERPLRAILEKYPQVRFVTVGQPSELAHEQYPLHHLGIGPKKGEDHFDFMLRYYRLLDSMDFDIAIAPLQPNTFNRCKSAVKLLEYGMVGVPVVASNFGPYVGFSEWALNAGTDSEWVQRLYALVESPANRAAHSSGLRKEIEDRCTIATQIPHWRAALLGVPEPCSASPHREIVTAAR